MNTKHFLPTLILIIVSALCTQAQTTIWLGTTNSNWNEVSNWDNGIPTITGHAIINDVANAPEITTTVNIQELTLNIDAIVNLNGGSLDISTDLNNNAGFLNLNLADASITGNINNSGTINVPMGRTLSVATDFTNDATLIVDGTLRLFGTNNQNLGGTSSFVLTNFLLDKTAGTVSLNQTMNVTNTLSIPTGVTFDANTGSFSLANNLTNNGTLDIDINVAITGNINNSGTINLNVGGNLSFIQNFTNSGTINSNAGSSVELQNTNNQTLDGTNPFEFNTFTINKTAGNIVLDQNVSIVQDLTIPTGVNLTLNTGQTLTLSNNFINNGTFDNTSIGNTIEFDGTSIINLPTGLSTFRNLTINKTGAGSVTIDQDATVRENLLVSSGTFNLNTGRILQVEGNFTNNGDNFASPAGSIVELIGTNNQSIAGTAQIQFDVLQVSKTTGLILIDRNPVTVVQDFTIPSGVSFEIGAGDNFDVHNDFVNNGTILPTAGGVRFREAGTAELRGTGVMNFRDIYIQKTGAGNNVDIKVPVDVASWLIIDNNSQMTLEDDITVGGAGSIARMQNHGTIVHNNNSFIVEGTGNYNVQGNTETEFYEMQITKTTGMVIFEQTADILQDFTVPTGVTLQVGANRDLRLEGDLIMNGTNDNSQSASGIHFTGTNDATVSGTGVPINFRNFFNQKTNNNTVTITVNTEYLFNFRTDAGNTTRIEDGLTTFVQNDTDSRIYGTLSIGNNVTMNYNSGNTEVRIENGGNFIQDLGSNNTIAGRVRILNGGTFTVSNGSTLINSGRVFRSEDGGTVNLTANSNLTIYRDLQLTNASVLNFDNTSWIEFQGGDNSDIETGNTNLNIPNLRINKTGNVVDLRRQVTITNYIDLVSRHINSNDGDLLVFADGATHSGGSTASYIDGPARKIGNTNFEFPIGKNGRFGKLELQVTTAGATTDFFDVEYFGTIFLNTSLAAPLTDVSDNEYWQVERSGTTTATVVLHWTDDIASGIGPTAITESDLRVAQWNNTALQWEDRGNTTGTPTNSLASNPNQNIFVADRYWTLAYTGGDNDNWGASTWIGNVSDDWDDANNWQPAVVPDITMNAIIIGDRALTGNNDPNKKISGGSTAVVKNLYMPRVIFPTGAATTQKPALTVDAGVTIQVGDGTANTGLVECYGDIINNGTIETNTNNRFFNVYDEAIITNNGTINTTSQFRMYNDAELTNHNTMDIGGHFRMEDNTVLTNNSVIDMAQRLEMYDNAILTNNDDLDIGNDLNIRQNASFRNPGTSTTDIGDDILMEGSTDLQNDGTITVNDDIVLRNGHPDIFNNGTITATGDLDARSTSTINNYTGAVFNTARTTIRNDAIYTNDGTHNATSTITFTNNAELTNNTGAFFGVIGTGAASIFLQNSATVTNAVGATLQSRRQFELQAAGVTVSNNGLIRWRQDFQNNGDFSGTGTMEVYDNHTANTRIYGTSTATTPFIIHQLVINRTGGIVTQERSTRWTNDVTVPANVEYEIETGLYNTVIEGNFTIEATATFDLQGDAKITLEGDMTNNGTVIPNNSTVEFQGGTDKLINGSSTTNFYNLINNKNTATLDLEANIIVQNDLTNTDGTFNISSGFEATIQGDFINNTTFNAENNTLVSFTGAANSDISGSNAVVFADLTINKTGADVDLSREVEVREDLTLTSGLVNSSSTNLLILRDNATSTVGNANSYVNGVMRKIGDDAFVFPVGKGGRWARIAISSLAATDVDDFFEAEYSIGNSPITPTNVPLNHVSTLEHWDLNRGNTDGSGGTTQARVTLYWEDGTWSQIQESTPGILDLAVANWSGGAWHNRAGNIIGTIASGDITTPALQAVFGPFTFGSITGDSPLPIRLLDFQAKQLEDTQTYLTWQTASEENSSHFEVERSTDAINFETIADLEAQGFSASLQNYSSIDTRPQEGINYYRLKMVDQDNTFEYSEIVAVNFENIERLEVSKIYPNPFTTTINLELSLLSNQKYQVVLRNLQGKIVWSKEVTNKISGKQTIKLENLNHLPNATYLLEIIQNNEKIIKRVVKM